MYSKHTTMDPIAEHGKATNLDNTSSTEPSTSNMTLDEYKQLLHRHRTIYNWKKNYGVEISIDEFESFKRYKKIYLELEKLDVGLVKKFIKL